MRSVSNTNLPSVAIFSNFFIDNEERFKRMKDSFYSFKDINCKEWFVNIRGRFKYDVAKFLKNQLQDKVHIFHLESKKGWFYDSNEIAKNINASYVFIWVEDHLLIASPDTLNNCISEMKDFNADQLWYSWFMPNIILPYNVVKIDKQGKYISVRKIDGTACAKIREEIKNYSIYRFLNDFYIISMTSVMRKDFFMKILTSPKPYLKRWSQMLPFDFEKRSKDNVVPIIKHAISNQELFVPIDDNGNQKGYSLISRGLYPNRVSRESMKVLEFGEKNLLLKCIKKITPKPIRKIFLFFRRVFWTIGV